MIDLILLSKSCRYHCIKIEEIPELSKNSVGILVNLPDEPISMCLTNLRNEESFLTTIINDNETYVMRFDTNEFEITNRTNKGRLLVSLDDGYVFGKINKVNLRDKESKCSLIGRYSTSQISVTNLRTCESGIDTKKVPVETIGILQYVI